MLCGLGLQFDHLSKISVGTLYAADAELSNLWFEDDVGQLSTALNCDFEAISDG